MGDSNKENKEIDLNAVEATGDGQALILRGYVKEIILVIEEGRESARNALTIQTAEEREDMEELLRIYGEFAKPRTKDELNAAVHANLEGLIGAEILAIKIRRAAAQLMEEIVKGIGSVIAGGEKGPFISADGVEKLSIVAFEAAGKLGSHTETEKAPVKLLTTRTTHALSTRNITDAMERPIRSIADHKDIARHIEAYVAELAAIVGTKIKGHTSVAGKMMRMLGGKLQGMAEDLILYERSGGNPKTFAKIQGAILRLLIALDELMSHLENNIGQVGVFLKGINTGIVLKALLKEAREAGRRELEGGKGASPETVRKVKLLQERRILERPKI